MKKSHKKHITAPVSRTPDSLSSLASRIADDFNNILTTVMGACTLIDKDDPGNRELLQYVALIRASAERAAKLSEILTFVVTPEQGNEYSDNKSQKSDVFVISVRDKKTIHDIVSSNNGTDGASS